MVVWESVPDQGVAVGPAVLGGEDHPGQVLEVDLVADAHARGAPPGTRRRPAGPSAAAGSARCCAGTRCRRSRRRRRPARRLGDHRVVDDQLDRDERVDPGRVAAELAQGVAHGGEVDHAGHPGEVLHEHPLGGQGDLGGVRAPRRRAARVHAPAGHRLDVGGRDGDPVLVAEEVLQDDLDGVGQSGDVEAVGEGVDPEDLVGARRRRCRSPRAPKESGEVGELAMPPFCPVRGPGESGAAPLRSGCGTGGWRAG